jgi:hypothetical protein
MFDWQSGQDRLCQHDALHAAILTKLMSDFHFRAYSGNIQRRLPGLAGG